MEMPAKPSTLDRRIAQRLAALRAERGWSLADLASRTGLSRPTLSRLERCELSPTADVLNALCAQYGFAASRLMAEAEASPPSLIRAAEQVTWQDPESGFVRRVVSPPDTNLRGELVEVHMPAGAMVHYGVSPLPGLEHHLWILDGSLTLEIEDVEYRLEKGDCVRYRLSGKSRFVCGKRRAARYIIAIVRP
jgi:transcriptional regulator with XRE-family HTH domain